MAKAGATANAFGLDMDQLNAVIGTVTAATKQSGNEVGNFVKSVLPRLLSKPAQSALQSLNVSFIDKKTGDMRDVMSIYEEVAKKVQNISKVEKAAVMEGLAGKFHISRMTAFLDNFSMYKKMLDESRNSENSASLENEKYMKSLTARIALMKQSLEEIALSLGKSFLTEGFIQTLKVITSLAHGFVGISKVVGGLPLILGTAGIAALLLSKNLKTATIQSTLMSSVFAKLRVEANLLKIGIASIGVGAGLFVFGIALEQVLKKMGEARERAEEFARKNKELTDSYKENRKDVQNLTEEYVKLDKKIRSGTFDTNDIERYRNISNELATLMPKLANGEDQYGNKILGSNEALKSKIELLEKQTAVQEKADAIKKKTTVEENYKDSGKDLKSAKKDLDNFFISDANQTPFVSNIKEAYSVLEEYRNKLAKGEKLSILEKGEFENVKTTIDSYETLKSEVEGFKLAYQQSVMDMIDVNLKLDGSTGQLTKSMIDDFTTFVATSDASEGQISKVLSGVLNSVKNDKGFKNTLEGYSDAIISYQNAIDSGADPKKIEDYRNKAVAAFTEVKTVLIKLAKDGKIDESTLNVLSSQLDGVGNSAVLSAIDFDKLSKSTGKSVEELKANLLLAPQMDDMYSDMGDSAGDAAENVDKLTKAIDDASKQYDDSISKITDLSKALYDLEKDHELSSDSISTLASKYPELLAYIGDEKALREHLTEAIDSEKNVAIDAMVTKLSTSKEFFSQAYKANKAYFDGLAKLYDVDLKNTNTLAQLKAQIEGKLISSLGDSWAQYYDAQTMSFTAAGKAMLEGMGYQEAINSPQLKIIAEYEASMKAIADTMRNFTGKSNFVSGISGISDAIRDNDKAKKENNKETEYSSYVSDKYKKKIEELTLAIAEQQKIQKKFPTYSKEYQNALKEEIKQLKLKKKAIDDEAKSLQKQIDSGKIIKKGEVVTTDNTTTTTNESSSSGMDKLIAEARKQSAKGTFKYKQVGGEFKGTYKEFLNRALSDCSQFAQEYFEKFLNVKLPRTAATQWDAGKSVKKGEQKVGDLVFWNTTGKKHSHVGIYTGNGKAMQMGSKGLKEIDISSYKGGKFEGYRRIDGVGTASKSSTTTKKASNSSKTWDFLKSKGFSDTAAAGVLGNIQQESNFNPTAVNKSSGAFGIGQWLGGRLANLKKYAKGQDKSYKSLDVQLEFLYKELNGGDSTTKSKLSKYGGLEKLKKMSIAEATKVFEDAFERSGGSAMDKRKKNADSNYNKYKGTDSKTRANQAKDVDDAESEVNNLKDQLLEIQEEIEATILEAVQAGVSVYDHKNKELEDDFADIDLKMQRENEGSKAWTDLQLKKEKLLSKEKKNQQDAIDYLKDQIKNNKDLTAAQKELLGDEIIDRTKDLLSLEQQILEERQNMADKIIDTYKQALEAQKQAALDSIDKMLDEIDKKEAEADYKKELKKKQNSKQELMDELNSLMLDDSDSAKKRIDEIQKQLQESNSEIDDYQHSHEVDQRKTNLNDQKDQITKSYDDLINDEKKFAQMRSDIINANSEQIKKDLQKYYDNIKANSSVLGKAMSNNLIDLINQANRYLNGKDYKPIKVAQAEAGGILPNWSNNNGRLMYVHPEEMISNKIDTRNILKALDISANIARNFPIPKLPTFTPSVANAGNTISINLNIDKMTGNQSDIDKLLGAVRTEFKRLGM